MSIWFAIPSKKPVSECNAALRPWRDRGYRVAVFRDEGDEAADATFSLSAPYPGYAQSVNWLCRAIIESDRNAQWIVTGGDDVLPDPDHSLDQIADECTAHFGGTFGVMECTGDRWLVDADGRCSAEKACIAPWLGREWCEKANGGAGPYFPGYYHFFCDAEIKMVAEKAGVLWHRPDLFQYHDNWQRMDGRKRPAYLENAVAAHDADRQLFLQRKAAGFP